MQLVSVINEMKGAGEDVQERGEQMLARVSESLVARNLDLREAFDTCDLDKKGALTQDELLACIRRLMPSIKVKELRFILADSASA